MVVAFQARAEDALRAPRAFVSAPLCGRGRQRLNCLVLLVLRQFPLQKESEDATIRVGK